MTADKLREVAHEYLSLSDDERWIIHCLHVQLAWDDWVNMSKYLTEIEAGIQDV